jgi:hypothetical protein
MASAAVIAFIGVTPDASPPAPQASRQLDGRLSKIDQKTRGNGLKTGRYFSRGFLPACDANGTSSLSVLADTLTVKLRAGEASGPHGLAGHEAFIDVME